MRIVTCLVLSFFLLSCSSKKYTQEMAPPFERISIAPAKFVIDASKDTLLNFTNGSSLTIPANAFVNSKGDTIKGNVALEYKQFNSAAEIIASGIPMTFEGENGEGGKMESAGMFELRGNVNNEEVFIAKGKKVNVNMSSDVKGEFDFFYLEEEGKKTATTGFIPAAYAQDKKEDPKKVRWTRLTNNTSKPEEEIKDEKSFTLQFDTALYPETKYLQTVQWKPWNDSANMNPLQNKYAWALKEKWELLEFSKASLPLKLVNEVKLRDDSASHAYLGALNDSNYFILFDKNPSIWNFNGKKKADFPISNDVNHSWMGSFVYGTGSELSTKDRIILYNKENEAILWTTDGKKLFNIGQNTSTAFLDEGKKIVSFSRLHDTPSLTFQVFDKNGKELSKKAFVENNPSMLTSYILSKDNKTFAITLNGEIIVFNSEGNVLKTIKTGIENHSTCEYIPYHDAILFDFDEKHSKIWDWKNDKIYTIPGLSSEGFKNYGLKTDEQDLKPLLVVRTDEEIFLWNWETEKKTSLCKYNNNYLIPGYICGDLVYLFNENLSKIEKSYKSLFNSNGRLIHDHINKLEYDPERHQMLIKKGKEILLLNDKGILIKDFTRFDSTIGNAFFSESKKVGTISGSGNVCYWDQNGKLIRTFNIDLVSNRMGEKNDLLFGKDGNDLKVWDLNGNFISFIDPNFYMQLSPEKQIATITGDGKYLQFLEIGKERIPEGIYQISLKSKHRSIRTYVRLDRKEMKEIEKYTEGKNKKLLIEQKREEKENTVLRSFEISKFGIYNWDRIYKEENVIQLAADFDFGNKTSIYNEGLSVFLISGIDQNIVVKYPKDSWEKFSYDPAIPNRLMAVLPDDQIAIFDPKDFEALNKEEIKKSGKFTFKMKILDKLESMEALNKILKKPDKPA
jgi:hypothetical protein